MSAPVLPLTDLDQLPSSSTVKNPPGHSPSFSVSRLPVTSPRPPYSQLEFLPPPTTPCSTCVRLASKVMPLFARVFRTPPQSPVMVERDQRLPEYCPSAVWGCVAGLAVAPGWSSSVGATWATRN